MPKKQLVVASACLLESGAHRIVGPPDRQRAEALSKREPAYCR
jgi:hypothetical protein